jgi:glycerophosphoryl diester phosphodiesterase
LAHGKNIPLHLYTFRDPNFESDYKYLDKFGVKGFDSKEEELSFFISKGVDAIMTDYITSALAIRNQLYDQTAQD